MATKKQKQKETQRQLKKKLVLERSLLSDMRGYFNRLNTRFFDMLTGLGIVLDAEDTRQELESILTNHYDKTTKQFYPIVVKEVNRALSAAGEQTVDGTDPLLIASILLFIRSNVTRASDSIIDTTNKEIAVAMDAGGADEAADHLKAKTLPRSKTIAMTETQKAAEGSKAVAAQTTQEIVAGVGFAAVAIKTRKTWLTRMDERVRTVHENADFQEVDSRDPFIVGGESLMFPGDTSLGASPWNTINCRCTVFYSTSVV